MREYLVIEGEDPPESTWSPEGLHSFNPRWKLHRLMAPTRGPTRSVPFLRAHKRRLSSADSRALRQRRGVLDVTAIAPYRLTRTVTGAEVDETSLDTTWGIKAVGADRSPYSGKDVTVAVLDTGIDAEHPAFQSLEVLQENFTTDGDEDRHGHGTHVAGVVCGQDVNGLRIGVARGVRRLLVGKVLNDEGKGDTETVYEGILWAVEQGAQVICMSLGFDFHTLNERLQDDGYPSDIALSKSLEDYRTNLLTFERLATQLSHDDRLGPSCLLIAAVGNQSRRDKNPEHEVAASPPSVASDVLAVGAVGPVQNRFQVADFSNTGPRLVAPGVHIRSARKGGGLEARSGTSMAAPFVAGCACLWIEANRAYGGPFSVHDARSVLVGGASRSRVDGEYEDLGRGLVQAPQTPPQALEIDAFSGIYSLSE